MKDSVVIEGKLYNLNLSGCAQRRSAEGVFGKITVQGRSFQADSGGKFRMVLPPGTYSLSVNAEDGPLFYPYETPAKKFRKGFTYSINIYSVMKSSSIY
jgi:hypothetical protein